MNWKTLKAPFKALVIVAVCAVSIWAVWPLQQEDSPGARSPGRCASVAAALSPTAEVPHDHDRRCRRRRARSSTGASTASASPSRRSATSAPIASWSSLPNVKNPDEAEKLLKQVAVLEYKIVPFDVMQKADAARARCSLQPNVSAKDKRGGGALRRRRPPTRRAATSFIPARISRPRRPVTIRPAGPTSTSKPRIRRDSES